MRAVRFGAAGFEPGVVEELRLGFAADEFRRGVFEDAGDVGVETRSTAPSRTCAIFKRLPNKHCQQFDLWRLIQLLRAEE